MTRDPYDAIDAIDVKSSRLGSFLVVGNEDFHASAEWQDYLGNAIGSRMTREAFMIKVRDDAEDYSFKGGRRKNGRLYGTATIPSAWLGKRTAPENADVYRAATERFYTDLAAVADLPAPPPLPPKLPPLEEQHAPGGGIAWMSDRKRFKGVDLRDYEWFFADEAWQDYLPRTQGDLYHFVYLIEDVDELTCTHGRARNGEVNVNVHVPAERFVNNPDPELTMAETCREAFVWAAEKFGWPEPPPVPKRPPGHEKPARPINPDVGPLRPPSRRH